MREVIQLTVDQIREDLENGLKKRNIKEKYGLSHADVNLLFEDERIKNIEIKKKPGFVLLDSAVQTVLGDREEENF